jgi:ElaB/YqjD/DUF883 family membrane-anchored ribosome-binding protein
MEALLHDLRYAARSLRRSPGFALAAILTLALGISANTTIFSAVNAFLFRPLDSAEPARMVRIHRNQHSPLLYDQLEFVRENARSFSGVFGERKADLGMDAGSGSEAVAAELVHGNFFTTLGIGATRGRLFGVAEDAAPGANPVIVLSHRFWQRRFDADPEVVSEDMALSLLPARVGAGILSLFGVLALLLAAVGIAGVVSHAVAERTHEIGVRSALGADRHAVLRLMIGDSMRRVAIGAAIGLALAMLLGWAAAGLLYGVSPFDPAVLLGAPLVLGTVALLAAYLPARRATRVDPMVALKAE